MGHDVDVFVLVIGPGEGDTKYRGTCRCGWAIEDYSPTKVLDAIGAHELGLS